MYNPLDQGVITTTNPELTRVILNFMMESIAGQIVMCSWSLCPEQDQKLINQYECLLLNLLISHQWIHQIFQRELHR